MAQDFYKALRWYLIACLMVGGWFFIFKADETQSWKPLMPALWCFGFGYVAAYFWHRYKRKVQLLSLTTFIVMGILALKFSFVSYILTGYIIDINFYLLWLGLNLFPGAVFMFFLFR